MTLAQSKVKTQASFDTRANIASLDNQIVAEQNKRDDADEASLATIQLIVNAVKSDPEEGEDGELYEAMGYTRKSASAPPACTAASPPTPRRRRPERSRSDRV